MKRPSGELTAAGSGGISVVSLIAFASKHGVELDPTVAGWLALAAGWIAARVRRYLDEPGRHAATDAE